MQRHNFNSVNIHMYNPELQPRRDRSWIRESISVMKRPVRDQKWRSLEETLPKFLAFMTTRVLGIDISALTSETVFAGSGRCDDET